MTTHQTNLVREHASACGAVTGHRGPPESLLHQADRTARAEGAVFGVAVRDPIRRLKIAALAWLADVAPCRHRLGAELAAGADLAWAGVPGAGEPTGLARGTRPIQSAAGWQLAGARVDLSIAGRAQLAREWLRGTLWTEVALAAVLTRAGVVGPRELARLALGARAILGTARGTGARADLSGSRRALLASGRLLRTRRAVVALTAFEARFGIVEFGILPCLALRACAIQGTARGAGARVGFPGSRRALSAGGWLVRVCGAVGSLGALSWRFGPRCAERPRRTAHRRFGPFCTVAAGGAQLRRRCAVGCTEEAGTARLQCAEHSTRTKAKRSAPGHASGRKCEHGGHNVPLLALHDVCSGAD